jgi:hypothetical protein
MRSRAVRQPAPAVSRISAAAAGSGSGKAVFQAGGGQLIAVGGQCRTAQVDTQRHRRMCVLGVDDVLPVGGILGLQSRQPPGREVPARFRVVGRRLIQFFALPLEVAQHRIDEGAGARKAAGCDADGFVDGSVGRGIGAVQFVEPDQEMAEQVGGLEGTPDQAGQEKAQSSRLPQGAIGQVLGGGPDTRIGIDLRPHGDEGLGQAAFIQQYGVDQIGREETGIRHGRIVAR